MRRFVITISCLLLLASGVRAMDTQQLALLLREATLSAAGAPREALVRLTEQLRRNTYNQIVTIQAATLQEFEDVPYSESVIGPRQVGSLPSRLYLGCYQVYGHTAGPCAQGYPSTAAEREAAGIARAAAARLFGFPINTATGALKVLRLEQQLQNLILTYRIAVPVALITDLRRGQRLALNATITGIDGPDAGDRWEIVARADRVMSETKTLRCPQGHEYAPTSGYQFCPLDGLPLS